MTSLSFVLFLVHVSKHVISDVEPINPFGFLKLPFRADSRFAPSQWETSLQSSYIYIYIYIFIYLYVCGLRCYCMCLNNLQCMMTSSNLNIFRVTGPSCGEFTGHWSPVNPPHKGLWREALLFSLICSWINGWVNNREAGDLRHNRAHYDVIVMVWLIIPCMLCKLNCIV